MSKTPETKADSGTKKPVFQRPWFQLLVAVIVVVAIAGACGGNGDKDSTSSNTTSQSDSKEQKQDRKNAEREAKEQQRKEQKAAQEAEDAEKGKLADSWYKTQMGLSDDASWMSMLDRGPEVSKYASIQSITIGHGSNVVVEAQLDRKTEEDVAKSMAETMAGLLRNVREKPEWSKDASFVIIEDGTNTHMAQVRI
ncbi:hypothetical protein ACUY3K_04820 [Corynebacterium uberis]|uniref:hypothetical protein n=1 Tax=Corynebacterium uberis TaxID=2883169 RepID=UPI001D0B1CC8|nr:hypothetical protein [Corynebacterium uberis]UDL73771.1 hypothetical protein LH391_00595 [Corynebacterium uberis]UDL81974.1 hypothetical protein LH395_08805 [Corynebacterium uberis]